MKLLQLHIHDEMFYELVDAAANSYLPGERPVKPEDLAADFIESALATRRLDRLDRLTLAR